MLRLCYKTYRGKVTVESQRLVNIFGHQLFIYDKAAYDASAKHTTGTGKIQIIFPFVCYCALSFCLSITHKILTQ